MRRIALALSLSALLAGCGSLPSFTFFGEKEVILEGERESVFSTTAPLAVAGGTVTVAPPRANADWPQPGGNAQNAPGHLAYQGGGARVWRTSIGGDGSSFGLSMARGRVRIAARPVVAGDTVYVYAPNGTVTALSASSGNRVWRTSLRPEGEGDPAAGGGVTVANGRVFVATGYGQIAALSAASGEVIWNRDIDNPARGAPTAGDGKVFVVSQKNRVFAVNQEDGSAAFEYSGIPEQAGLVAASSPAVSSGKVVIPYSSGEVMAFSTESGEPIWQNFVTRSQRTLAVSGINDLSGSPVIDGSTVFATGVSGRTIAVGLSDGAMRWERDIGSAHTPVVSGDAVFVVDLANRMVALDRQSGEIKWVAELPRPKKKRDRAYAGPVLAGGSLWAISNNGRLVQVEPATGNVLSDRDIGSAAYTAPIVAGGQMFVVSDTGEITALR